MNIQGRDGFSAPFFASHNGHLRVVCALLNDEEVDLNIRNDDGSTTLDGRGEDDVVHLLEEHLRIRQMRRVRRYNYFFARLMCLKKDRVPSCQIVMRSFRMASCQSI